MRLIEFLQQSVPEEPTPFFRRIPLEILAGSQEEYARFIGQRTFESIMLNEAAIDKYAPSINVFQKIDGFMDGRNARYHEMATRELQWAIENLRREDRIVWYMRWVKVSLLEDATKAPVAPSIEDPQGATDAIRKEYNKHMGKMRKLQHGSYDDVIEREANRITDGDTKNGLAHYMSLNIPKMNDVTWSSQWLNDLLNQFKPIEKEWMERRSQVIDHSQDDAEEAYEKLIQFEDGSAWFNLNRRACSIEGDAMGHCGNNDGGSNSNEVVLSYRVPVNDEGQPRSAEDGTHWKPRLTFIWDSATGLLGEMKARANSKPKEELHPYIIDLLMHPMVKGIVGGGYRAENNFSLDDLGDDKKVAILQQKPELGTLSDMLLMSDNEVTPAIVSRLEAMMDEDQIDYESIEDDHIVIESWDDLDAFIDHHESELRVLKYISKYLNGEEHIDHFDGHYSNHGDKVDLAQDAFGKDPALWKQIQAYMQKTYPDQLEEEEIDIDDVDEVLKLAEDEGEEFYDQLGYAISDGHRYGAEAEMAKAYNNWADGDVFRNTDFSIIKEGENLKVVVDLREFVKKLWNGERGEYDLDDIARNGWSEAYERLTDIDEPRYGWDGYDEDAAIESFIDNANIPEVPEIEVPDGGSATAENKKQFEAEVKKIANSDTVQGMIERYKTVVRNIQLVNGAITADAYTWKQEFSSTESAQTAFANALKDLAVIASEVNAPLVVRGMNRDLISDKIQALGYKAQDNGYLRFDPKGLNEATRIKLRGFGQSDATGDTDEFLYRWEEMTQEHPHNRKARVFGNGVSVEIDKWGDGIHLGDITSLVSKGAGEGTKALKALTALADQTGVKISGVAKAYSKAPGHIQDNQQLVNWYTKHGFVVTNDIDPDDYGTEIEYQG